MDFFTVTAINAAAILLLHFPARRGDFAQAAQEDECLKVLPNLLTRFFHTIHSDSGFYRFRLP
jgi:hypothetical protein